MTIEEKTKEVFGDTFKEYIQEEHEKSMYYLKARLLYNGVDPDTIFKGKRCLDAGCGNGRGTLLMLLGGAESVTAFDLSGQNLESTKKYLKKYKNYDIIGYKQGSILDLPFNDESFDFVWSNGVIHHTGDTAKAFTELSRVLKLGGLMWLYVYGSGGIYWKLIDFIRGYIDTYGIEQGNVIKTLIKIGYPPMKIAEFIDDWFCPVLDRYTKVDLLSAASKLGLFNYLDCANGMLSDTSMRRRLFPSDGVFMGEGDLRFLFKKIVIVNESCSPIYLDNSNNEYGLSLMDFGERLRTFPHNVGNSRAVKAFAELQVALRSILGEMAPFDVKVYKRYLDLFETVKSKVKKNNER